MALEIYDGATFLYALPRVMSASLTDKLSGERTLSFSTLISVVPFIVLCSFCTTIAA